MKVIIAGPRDTACVFKSYGLELVRGCYFASGFQATEFVSGGASGVDNLCELLADQLKTPLKMFRPDYGKYGGKQAPIIRNGEMADYADALILIWDGTTPGSQNMKLQAKAKGLAIYEVTIRRHKRQ